MAGPRTPIGRVRLAMIAPERSADDEVYRSLDSYALSYLIDGDATFRDAHGHEASVVRGSMVLVWPGVAHWYGPTPGASLREALVVFDGPLFDALLGSIYGARREVVRHLPGPSFIDRLWAVFPSPPPTDPVDAVGELWDLGQLVIDVSVSDAETSDRAMAAACGLLQADLTATRDLAEVAREFGLTYDTFRRRFATEVGTPPARYRDERRIDAATELLRCTQLTQRQIADLLGFADEFHFSRRFRSLAGEPPGAVRRARKNNRRTTD